MAANRDPARTAPWPPIRGAPEMPNHAHQPRSDAHRTMAANPGCTGNADHGRQPRSGAHRTMAANPGRTGNAEPCPATAIRCERVVPSHARQPRTSAATVRNRMPPDRQRVGRAPDRRPTSRSGHRDPATKSSRAWLGSTGIRVNRTMAGNPGRTGNAEPWPPTAIRRAPHHGRQSGVHRKCRTMPTNRDPTRTAPWPPIRGAREMRTTAANRDLARTAPWPPIRGAPVMPNHAQQPRSGANG